MALLVDCTLIVAPPRRGLLTVRRSSPRTPQDHCRDGAVFADDVQVCGGEHGLEAVRGRREEDYASRIARRGRSWKPSYHCAYFFVRSLSSVHAMDVISVTVLQLVAARSFFEVTARPVVTKTRCRPRMFKLAKAWTLTVTNVRPNYLRGHSIHHRRIRMNQSTRRDIKL